MTAVLGYLALIQMAVLPGMVLVGTWRLAAMPYLPGFVLAASLTFNYCLVMALVTVGLYLQTVVLIIFLLLVAATIWLWRRGAYAGIPQRYTGDFRAFRTLLANTLPQSATGRIIIYVGLIASALLIAGAVAGALVNIRGVFEEWDAIASWNRWARALAAGHVSSSTSGYTQLLPANWSLSYAFMGTDRFVVAASALDRIIVLGLFATVSEAGLRSHRASTSGGVFLLWLMLLAWPGAYWVSDADVPVSFFCALAVLLFIASIGNDDRATPAPPTDQSDIAVPKTALFWCGVIVAVGLGATKQAGLFFVLPFPLWFLLLRLSLIQGPHSLRGVDVRKVLLGWSIMLVVTLSWYAYVRYYSGSNFMVEELTQNIHKGRGYLERFPAWLQHSWSLNTALGLGVMVTAFAGLTRPGIARFFALFSLAFMLIWATLYSYDGRNAALALPVAALSASIVIDDLIKRLDAPLIRLEARLAGQRRRLVAIVLIVAAVAIVAGIALNSSRLDERAYSWQQRQQLLRVGSGEASLLVLAVLNANPGKTASAFTDDPWVCLHPLLEHRLSKCTYTVGGRFDWESRYGADIHFLVVRGRTPPDELLPRLFLLGPVLNFPERVYVEFADQRQP